MVLGLAAAAEPGRGAAPAPPAEPSALVDAGRFAEAARAIDAALARDDLPPARRRALEFERERMRRIRLDFPLSEPAAKAKLREHIPDLREDEFQRWKASQRLEHLEIDGTPYYFARSISNLFLLSPEAAARRATPRRSSAGPMESPNAHHREALDQARSGDSSVAPRRVRVTQTLTVDADAVPAGETVRAWIPYPLALPGQQEDIRLLASEPAQAQVAPERAPQRTVYFERRAQAGKPTRFSVSYELTVYARQHLLDPAKVRPLSAHERAGLAEYLAERPPHIVFSDAVRRFSREVVGDETDPYRIAQKLFAAVDRFPWAGAREYSTLSNISDYVLRTGHGDCGQQTLLLITLLRLNGIPARWQSGMVYSDGAYDNLHDWGQLYLAPYGWVPMDVTTGRFADAGDPGLEWFYLGGIDAYRIAFNDDYGREFVPPKRHFRSETVDSQRGEAEWDGGNLYFDQWDYAFEAEVLPAGGTR
ncbi:transglutaminase-like domain-containing protein [Vulcaniibacterium tengchongense]|uniref:Transglutaminase-like putative cysteine protease n=1 Tax=Vulcaniibacterium tengchongense TaxID=1273429 RepID=A0A3N4VBI1_9GAMM|nr:transglutaminase domain-containing protein [Vulcaniibacterium tengchongense]RPE77051.1 transglutaminase-like putative cysteine protease [Vulcaniibacterium tengchongense]